MKHQNSPSLMVDFLLGRLARQAVTVLPCFLTLGCGHGDLGPDIRYEQKLPAVLQNSKTVFIIPGGWRAHVEGGYVSFNQVTNVNQGANDCLLLGPDIRETNYPPEPHQGEFSRQLYQSLAAGKEYVGLTRYGFELEMKSCVFRWRPNKDVYFAALGSIRYEKNVEEFLMLWRNNGADRVRAFIEGAFQIVDYIEFIGEDHLINPNRLDPVARTAKERAWLTVDGTTERVAR